MQPTLRADLETRSSCDLRRAGVDIYAKHPTTDVLCMAFAICRGPLDTNPTIHLWKRGEPFSEELKSFFLFLKDGSYFRAWNATFELLLWNNVLVKKYGFPWMNPSRVECTMAKAYAMGLPGSLEKAAPAAGIEEAKDMAGSRIMMQLSKPREVKENGDIVWWEPNTSPEKFEKLYSYCIQDLKVEAELDRRLRDLSPEEKKVWQLDYEINRRGIRVDLPAVKRALELVEFEKDRLNALMKETTAGAVATCTATGQLTDWIGWQLGEELDGVAKADVLALLARDLPENVRKALLLRQEAAKSSTAKLKSMLEAADPQDFRVRGTKQYCGAGTGRWAGRKLQVDNFPRGNLAVEEVDAVFDLMGDA